MVPYSPPTRRSGHRRHPRLRRALAALSLLFLSACESLPEAPLHAEVPADLFLERDYRIVPGDRLSVFVWQDRDLSLTVTVRPDGRISLPLAGELEAAGRVPSELARELERRLSSYVQEPVVTVIVAETTGSFDRRVRVVGEAAKPQSLVWRPGMTALDAIIEAGGLTEFAAGNRSVLVRRQNGEAVRYRLRLADLLQEGDVAANPELLPGDVIIVPQALF
ncbi:Polysialic acid transport protein KpsD [bacterium HR40]|nr:Polysialic acid transport protein KpsD [bacterium HR40]